ncbi:hypothetical protein NMG60_11026962 [Bertholletia excelsa]
MAKLAFTFALIFFLFAFTNARIPIDNSVNSVADHDLSNSLSESDVLKPTLFLPTENTEFEPTTDFELEPQTAETKQINDNVDREIADSRVDGMTEDLLVSDIRTADDVPLNQRMTNVRIRPINRHFPAKSPYFVRVPHRGCRHMTKPMMNAQIHRGEISYGDDAVLAGERGNFDPEMLRGGRRQNPETPMNFRYHPHPHHHHHGEGMQRFPLVKQYSMLRDQRFKRPSHREEEQEREEKISHNVFGEQRFRRPFRREEAEERDPKRQDMFSNMRFGRPFRQEEEREEMKGREERQGGGFLGSFRKFLDQF